MKKTVATILALGFSSLSLAASAQITTPVVPSAPVVPGQPSLGMHDRHPEIRKAMEHLNQAETNLQEGAKDFAGHKVQAMQLIDQAKQQLQLAMQDAGH